MYCSRKFMYEIEFIIKNNVNIRSYNPLAASLSPKERSFFFEQKMKKFQKEESRFFKIVACGSISVEIIHKGNIVHVNIHSCTILFTFFFQQHLVSLSWIKYKSVASMYFYVYVCKLMFIVYLLLIRQQIMYTTTFTSTHMRCKLKRLMTFYSVRTAALIQNMLEIQWDFVCIKQGSVREYEGCIRSLNPTVQIHANLNSLHECTQLYSGFFLPLHCLYFVFLVSSTLFAVAIAAVFLDESYVRTILIRFDKRFGNAFSFYLHPMQQQQQRHKHNNQWK